MLYTHREYEKGLNSPTHIQKVNEEKPVVEMEKIEYLVLHPENEVGNYYDGTYPLDIDGNRVNIEFNHGTAIVTDKRVRDALLDCGFLLLAEKIIKEN